MENKIENLVICDAVRTPFSHSTGIKENKSSDLLELVIRTLVKRNKLKSDDISGVITGCVQQDTRATNIARIGSMKSDLSEKLADYSVQANCNSGFVGALTAIGNILSGIGDLYFATGVESMSNFGYRLEDKTNKYGSVMEIKELIKQNGQDLLDNFDLVDCLMEGLTDNENDLSMIEIAEIMANCFGITREEQDNYTLKNLERAVNTVEGNYFSKYLVPVGEVMNDTYPLNRKRMLKRPEQFSRTPAVFSEESPLLNPEKFYKKHEKNLKKLGVNKIIPTVTMYNSCIPGDGASGCIITTEEKANSLGLKPVLRIINWAVAGVNPVIMGIGPAESTKKLFTNFTTERSKGISFDQLNIIEIHEAFASQVLSVFKESEKRYNFKWDLDKVNVYGGSLAYTHPLGATNFRLLINILIYFDQNPNAKYGMACGCAGGGQGTSILFERY